MDFIQIGDFLVWGHLAQTGTSWSNLTRAVGNKVKSEAGKPGIARNTGELWIHTLSSTHTPRKNDKTFMFLLCYLISGFTHINIIYLIFFWKSHMGTWYILQKDIKWRLSPILEPVTSFSSSLLKIIHSMNIWACESKCTYSNIFIHTHTHIQTHTFFCILFFPINTIPLELIP